MKKILIGLSLVCSLFASVESEVDAERFSWKDGVLTDHFAGMQWQDNEDTITIKKDWQDAKDYCSSLTLGGKSDWRLPNRHEVIYSVIQKKFKYTSNAYWTSSIVTNDRGINQAWSVNYGKDRWNNKKYTLNFRCVRGNNFDNLVLLEKYISNTKKNKISKIETEIKEENSNIYNLELSKIKKLNTIINYSNFLKLYPNSKEALKGLYILVKQQNNIAGYEWFIKTYTNAQQVKEAIETIHTLAYNKAKSINTISAYNTFIIAYPLASQVNDANDRAYKLEEKEYTDIGLIGFFGKEEKLDRKARALLIKAKQIERISNDKSYSQKAGYTLVVNRMYKLLQDRFNESEATLRYLESQEFKDFVSTFKSVMRDISSKLSNIENYSSQIVEVSKQGFEDANADREMSRYKDEQHHQWEKRMHLREKGYN